MPTFRIGKGRYSRPSVKDATFLSKLNIPASNIQLDEPGEFGRWCRFDLPENKDFTFETNIRGDFMNTTIKYQDVSVVFISEKSVFTGLGFYEEYSFHVYYARISQLENDGKLPIQSPEIKVGLKKYEKEKQYETMEKEYSRVCEEYIKKLQKDLKKFAGRGTRYNTETYQEPEDKTSLDHLAWQKYQIVQTAFSELKNSKRSPDQNIAACIAELKKPENVEILSKRRDTWFIGTAKIAFSLGTILIYRCLMGNQVTQGIKNVNFFAKGYQKMKDSENTNLEQQADWDPNSKPS